jgi:hypothetical protein
LGRLGQENSIIKNNAMTTKLITFFLSFIAIYSTAQTDGKIKNYNVDEFNRIVTHGGGNLQIGHSDKYTVQASTNNSCCQIEEISVSSKTLNIRIKDSKEGPCDCTIYIGVPVVDEIVQNEGGDIVLKKGFRPANSFQCKIRGGGNINVSELPVDSFSASITGGGHILLHAEKELEGNISGGGLIEYTGNPNVKRSISGGGTIRKR